ncbi:hypothetical protein DSO57_1005322 [Entomophthora muscae]|uniref:Uncharacterized protein n=1 Tax=Entomophthora muscae TaxID=34485 RepID=A0ACC2UU74_9FUNG|nr:hypothetical protein DSO57_1005322 [Entomophthora muscae]
MGDSSDPALLASRTVFHETLTSTDNVVIDKNPTSNDVNIVSATNVDSHANTIVKCSLQFF